jgi:pimeloyl-ACP methyl ester carboxylesterase
MAVHIEVADAANAPNLYIESKGRRIAYRRIGAGKPIVLCARFRGNMDIWDPAFLAALANQGFQVITFDYSGIGLSTGEKSFSPVNMGQDAIDLADALGLASIVISGWSLGGMAAQMALIMHPDRVSHGVLIGTTPPGSLVKEAEQLFYDTAVIPAYSLEEETILFFEPTSEPSREAARKSVARIAQRTAERSPPVPLAWSAENLGDRPRNPVFPSDAALEALKTTAVPILHIGGDHDIIFPVENWYALSGQLPTLQLLTFPRAGHGPQHEFPQACAEHIATFVMTEG